MFCRNELRSAEKIYEVEIVLVCVCVCVNVSVCINVCVCVIYVYFPLLVKSSSYVCTSPMTQKSSQLSLDGNDSP
jgi:hypothetical protein